MRCSGAVQIHRFLLDGITSSTTYKIVSRPHDQGPSPSAQRKSSLSFVVAFHARVSQQGHPSPPPIGASLQNQVSRTGMTVVSETEHDIVFESLIRPSQPATRNGVREGPSRCNGMTAAVSNQSHSSSPPPYCDDLTKADAAA